MHTTEPIVPEAQTITVRANADVLNEQLWNGYTLNDEETKRVTLSATEENVVVFQMKPAGFSISYLPNTPEGATVAMPENPDKYTIETESFTLNNPTCAGYTFLGWTTGKGTGPEITTPNKSVTIEKGSKGNLIFVANWERAEFTVNYEATEGGSVTRASEKVQVNGTAQGSTAQADSGWYLVGWREKNTENILSTEDTFVPQNVTKDVTYEAVFEQQTAITIQAKDFSKQYDGQPLVVPEDNWNIEQPNPLPDGFKAIVTLKPVEDNIVHVGESGKNQIDSVTILNKENEDVTKQYAITLEDGDLSITPKAVKVVTDDGRKTYDGQPLTASGRVEGLVEGESVTLTTTNSRTDAGETPTNSV